MRHGFPNLRHLRLATLVLEGATLREAAKQLSLTQPAASLAIGTLEGLYETPLFERAPHGLNPTPAGKILALRAAPAIATISAALEDFADRTELPRLLGSLTINQLAALATLRQHFGLRTASEALHISVATLRRIMESLEDLLGCRLTMRAPGGFTLNEAGRSLGEQVGDALAELSAAKAEIAESNGISGGIITVGAVGVTAMNMLPDTVLRMLAKVPDCRFQVMRDGYDALMDALRAGRIDYVCSTPRGPVPPEFDAQMLTRASMRVLCRPGHPLLREPKITHEHLARYHWIGPSAGTGANAAFQDYFRTGGMKPPAISVETLCTEWTYRLVAQGDFLWLTTTINESDPAQLNLAALESIDIGLTRPIYVMYRRGWRPTALNELFVATLHEVSAAAPPPVVRPAPRLVSQDGERLDARRQGVG